MLVELVNGDKYEFDLIRRTKENSIINYGVWLIND